MKNKFSRLRPPIQKWKLDELRYQNFDFQGYVPRIIGVQESSTQYLKTVEAEENEMGGFEKTEETAMRCRLLWHFN